MHKRYVILKKLRHFGNSVLWYAEDCKSDCYVEIKIYKSGPQILENAFDELEVLQLMAEKMKTE